MKRCYTIIYICMLVCASLFAQQPSQYSLYMLNRYTQNVGYAGLDNQSLSVTGAVRRQWNGLSGSPLTQTITAHLPVYYLHGALGIGIEQDMLGASRQFKANVSYAYHLSVGRSGTLSIGVGASILQRRLLGSELRTPDGQYEPGAVINHNDGSLPIDNVQQLQPDADLGLWYQSEKMELGISVRHLFEPKIKYVLQNSANIVLKRNYCFIFATELTVGNSIKIKPSVLFRSDIIQHQAEIASIVQYQDNIFAGVAFRGYSKTTTDALILQAGLKLSEHWTLGYAYDWTLSSLRSVSTGSHELVLNYNLNRSFGKGKMPPIIYNPRHL